MKPSTALFLLLVSLATGFVACSACKKEPISALRARCLDDTACAAGDICDPNTQACVDACSNSPCAVDQIAVNDGATCACMNADGVGSPCVADGDCAAATQFMGVPQTCAGVASPAPTGWPPGTICVPRTSCDVVTQNCADPDPSPQIQAKCVALTGGATTACTTECVNGATFTTCRFDQIPSVTGGVCTCVPRRDPYGDACTSDSDCSWPGGLLGNAGPTRTCRQIGTGRRCVPRDFCTKDETPATCQNGVDDDCDGIADGDETACLVEHCKDSDEDGFCDGSTCGKRRPESGDRPRAACVGFEMASCNTSPSIHPGAVEQCNKDQKVDENCDGTIDEMCQTFCNDADGDGFEASEPQLYQREVPGPTWTVCDPSPGSSEHPTCDNDPSRHSSAPCGPVVVQPPPPPPQLILRMRDVDDEAYAWLEQPSQTANAMCSIFRGQPTFDCDLGARLRERGVGDRTVKVVVMIVNSGCLNAQGWFEVLVDGAKRWESWESPAVRHCGWVFRHSFIVNAATGTVVDGTWESCTNDGDCRN